MARWTCIQKNDGHSKEEVKLFFSFLFVAVERYQNLILLVKLLVLSLQPLELKKEVHVM